MRILLLGEFSGLHKNLQIGLRSAGHSVDLVSTGDGFKSIFGDIKPPTLKSHQLWDKALFRISYYNFLKTLCGYDVVQLININIFMSRFFPYRNALNFLKSNNGKIFLLAAGSDAFYWQKSRQLMSYGPFEDELKYDFQSSSTQLQTVEALEFNRFIADGVDGIIPIAYDYAAGYIGFPNLCDTIPLPLDLDKVKFIPNKARKRIEIFHGLNRYGFKGTRHVEQAFHSLSSSYGNLVNCTIAGGMPLDDYLQILRETNIVIDQVNSYSYGMNAIYAAAMGKIVLSGAEPECLAALKITECPIVNLKPEPNDIKKKILPFLEPNFNFQYYAEKSRNFVEETHCCHLIASKYIKAWTNA